MDEVESAISLKGFSNIKNFLNLGGVLKDQIDLPRYIPSARALSPDLWIIPPWPNMYTRATDTCVITL